MKAYNLYGISDLRYEDVPMPECPNGWVIVKVKAAGICSSDIPRIFTKGTYHFPTIPGHEFSGIVYSVADEKNKNLVGKHVGVFPLIPCRECSSCKDKHYEMCEHYDYIGSRRDGAFAEYVAVPVWNLVELPEAIPFEEAAMMEPFAVALHALKIGKINAGMNVGIIGTGMIGIAGGQWSKKFGATTVSVIGRSEQKRDMVEACGLLYAVCKESAEVPEFDFVLEAVGTPDAVEKAICATKRGGTLVLMGNPCGDINISQIVYWKILRKQIRIVGTWNSAYDGVNKSDWTEVVSALSSKEIEAVSLITHRFDQNSLMKGLELMRQHKEAYCKVMTIWNS